MIYSIRNIRRHARSKLVEAELFEDEEKIASGPIGVVVDLAYMYAPGPFQLAALPVEAPNAVEVQPC